MEWSRAASGQLGFPWALQPGALRKGGKSAGQILALLVSHPMDVWGFIGGVCLGTGPQVSRAGQSLMGGFKVLLQHFCLVPRHLAELSEHPAPRLSLSLSPKISQFHEVIPATPRLPDHRGCFHLITEHTSSMAWQRRARP